MPKKRREMMRGFSQRIFSFTSLAGLNPNQHLAHEFFERLAQTFAQFGSEFTLPVYFLLIRGAKSDITYLYTRRLRPRHVPQGVNAILQMSLHAIG